LRHRNYEIWLDSFDGNDLIRKDATFRLVPGLADNDAYSFESINYPGFFRKFTMLTSLVLLACAIVSNGQTYTAQLIPRNNMTSNGTGQAVVVLQYMSGTMAVTNPFNGLAANTTGAHIDCCTASAGVGTAMAATPLPAWPTYPINTNTDAFYQTFDMTQSSSYNPAFLANYGNNASAAWTALYNGIVAGEALFNITTVAFPDGEITGFFSGAERVDPALRIQLPILLISVLFSCAAF